MINLSPLWLGQERELLTLLIRLREYSSISQTWMNARMSGLYGVHEDPGEEGELPLEEALAEEIIERYDSVGVISVNGHLVNDESPLLSWFGALGYPTVARAVNRLLDDEEIATILLSLNTHGGEASGVSELGDSIVAADKAKPVYAWTGSHALSAGYWIAASARNVYSTKMGETGSIGAVATLKVVHRLFKERGIDVHVARSAPKKAFPSPFEPLTKAGEEQLQKEVDVLHGFFVEYVASRRPALSQANSEGWASGDTFYGEEALALGLVDSPLQTINDLISELSERHTDRSDGDPTMPKHVVLRSEDDRNRLAAGYVAPEQSQEPVEQPPVEGAEQSASDPSATVVDLESGSAAPQEEVNAVTVADDPVRTFLQEREQQLRRENSDLQRELAEQRAEVQRVQGAVEQLELLREPMHLAVERLQVALGHRPMPLQDAPPKLLADTYNALYEELMGLPVGRQSQAADTAAEDREPRGENPGVPALVADRLRIVRNDG